jgi:hypothetical protein
LHSLRDRIGGVIRLLLTQRYPPSTRARVMAMRVTAAWTRGAVVSRVFRTFLHGCSSSWCATSPCCEPRGASCKGCTSLSRQPPSPPSPALAGAPC